MLIESALLAGELLHAHPCCCDNHRKRPLNIYVVITACSAYSLSIGWLLESYRYISVLVRSKQILPIFQVSLQLLPLEINRILNSRYEMPSSDSPFSELAQVNVVFHPTRRTAFIFFRHLHYPLRSTPRCSHHLHPYWGPLELFGPSSLPTTM